jgi:hypothetical protein
LLSYFFSDQTNKLFFSGKTLPNTISMNSRVEKIVKKKINKKYPLGEHSLSSLHLPPYRPFPRIHQGSGRSGVEYEDEELKEKFVSELITRPRSSAGKKNSSSNNNVFCSWVCVKQFVMDRCPKQSKYEFTMLIDLAAGYIV